jgi:hypothetical protein
MALMLWHDGVMMFIMLQWNVLTNVCCLELINSCISDRLLLSMHRLFAAVPFYNRCALWPQTDPQLHIWLQLLLH